MSKIKCDKCGETFVSKYKYNCHILKEIPCDYKCRICDKKFSKAGYYKHRKICKPDPNQIHPQNIISADQKNANNANNANNDISANTANSNNTSNSNNNVLLMTPFGMEHNHAFKDPEIRENVLGSARDRVVFLVEQGKLNEAYVTLFRYIHGNPALPQYHNIYMNENDDENVCVFSDNRFKLYPFIKINPKLFDFLKVEMKWIIKSATHLVWKIREQLMWDVQIDWMRTDSTTYDPLRQIMKKNKPIVEKTLTTNEVWPDIKAIASHDGCEPEQIITEGIPLKMY